jgi:hypothetical protein
MNNSSDVEEDPFKRILKLSLKIKNINKRQVFDLNKTKDLWKNM